MDDYLRRVRDRAYLIWEREGSPEGREVDNWSPGRTRNRKW